MSWNDKGSDASVMWWGGAGSCGELFIIGKSEAPKPDPLAPRPCPICGRVVVIILEFDRKRKRNSPWRVYHKGEGRCFLEGVKIHADTPEGAVAEWNERA